LPSHDGSRVSIELKLPAFAILRRLALARREMQPPLWLEGPSDSDGTATE
jgi:hypothetical protein